MARQVDWNNIEEKPIETIDEFFDIISNISGLFPGRAVYDIIRSYFRRVCPLSLVSEDADEMIRMESEAERYGAGVLPFPYGEVPDFVRSAFQSLAVGRNQFYRDDDMRREKGGK